MNNILSGLNDQQLKAVTTTEGYVRIIAGAGSGKTRALAHRYAYLVRVAGIPPSSILCVTFTNKAAGEMRRRVRALAGDGTDTSLITTYHGFCVRVLRESIGHLFWPENFRIIDESEQKKILEEIYADLGLKLDYASFEKIIDIIDKKKSTTDYVGFLCSREPCDPDAGATLEEKVVYRYMLYQKKIFGLDFNDLINFVFVLFEKRPDILEEWQRRLVYIQVDEFQDSSRREMKLIDMLAAEWQNLFVVGDPDQNIYEWRGADVSLLVDFDRTHLGTKTILLEQNYRSTGKILAAANELISHNKNRVPKTLFTTGEPGANVVHIHCRSEEEEAAAIVAEIRKLIGEGFRLRDIAILYRSGFLSQFLEKAFAAEGIPYEIFGSVRFFERMEIVDAISYLRLVERDDDEALVRVVNKPRRGFGRAKLEKLKKLAERDGISLLAALEKYACTPELGCPQVGELARLIYELRGKKDELRVSDILQRLLVESGYERYIRESGNMERLDNLSELKKITLESEREYGKTTLGDHMLPEKLPLSVFLEQLERAGDENLDDAVDRVKMMTVHAAKGLEFPVCFVVGMTDGIFPSSRTLEERGAAGLEEERRLCFVAITRAMKRIYLTDSEGEGQNGRRKIPSRFFADIGENNFVRVGSISKELADEMRAVAGWNLPTPAERLSVGSRVRHAVFGEGEIIGIDERRSVYEIRFDSGNVRPISMDYDFGHWQKVLKDSMVFAATAGAADGVSNQEATNSDIDAQDEPDTTEYDKSELLTPEAARRAPDRVAPPSKVDYTAGSVPRRKKEVSPEPDEQIKLTDELLDDFDDHALTFEPHNSIPEIEIPPPSEPLQGAEREETDDADVTEQFIFEGGATGDGEPLGLWSDPSVPKDGWICVGISDLGAPVGLCGMCKKQAIRYAHHMIHPLYPRQIDAGCVCAGRMEGDVVASKRREAELKSREARRRTFINHARKRSKNGNEYFKYNGDIITLLEDKYRPGHYKAVWRGKFTKPYPSPEDALSELFDLLTNAK